MSNQLGFWSYDFSPALQNRMEWVNNKFQQMWRAATPDQKAVLDPIMAEWWHDYETWRLQNWMWVPGVSDEVDAWELKADALRNRFLREGNKGMEKVPAGRPPRSPSGLDPLLSAFKWGAVVILAYMGYNIYRDVRSDWKEYRLVRRGRKEATAGLGYSCARRTGKLTTAKRSRLKPGDYGLPKQKKYPMPDVSHAINAKARAKAAMNQGHLTRAQYNQVVKKANRIIEACRGKRAA